MEGGSTVMTFITLQDKDQRVQTLFQYSKILSALWINQGIKLTQNDCYLMVGERKALCGLLTIRIRNKVFMLQFDNFYIN